MKYPVDIKKAERTVDYIKKYSDQIEKYKVSEIPQNLVDQEVKIITEGLKEYEIKKNLINELALKKQKEEHLKKEKLKLLKRVSFC